MMNEFAEGETKSIVNVQERRSRSDSETNVTSYPVLCENLYSDKEEIHLHK